MHALHNLTGRATTNVIGLTIDEKGRKNRFAISENSRRGIGTRFQEIQTHWLSYHEQSHSSTVSVSSSRSTYADNRLIELR